MTSCPNCTNRPQRAINLEPNVVHSAIKWIKTHGSEKLKLAVELDLLENFTLTYCQERLAAEMPGWEFEHNCWKDALDENSDYGNQFTVDDLKELNKFREEYPNLSASLRREVLSEYKDEEEEEEEDAYYDDEDEDIAKVAQPEQKKPERVVLFINVENKKGLPTPLTWLPCEVLKVLRYVTDVETSSAPPVPAAAPTPDEVSS